MKNLLMSWLIRKKEYSHKHWKQKMGKRNARFGSMSLVRQPVLQQKQRNPKSSRSQQRERARETRVLEQDAQHAELGRGPRETVVQNVPVRRIREEVPATEGAAQEQG